MRRVIRPLIFWLYNLDNIELQWRREMAEIDFTAVLRDRSADDPSSRFSRYIAHPAIILAQAIVLSTLLNGARRGSVYAIVR